MRDGGNLIKKKTVFTMSLSKMNAIFLDYGSLRHDAKLLFLSNLFADV